MNDDALPAPASAPPQPLKFLKAGTDIFGGKTDSDLDYEKAASQSREHLSDAINAKNVAFLLGAGCSSSVIGGDEKGIRNVFLDTTGGRITEAVAIAKIIQDRGFTTYVENKCLRSDSPRAT